MDQQLSEWTKRSIKSIQDQIEKSLARRREIYRAPDFDKQAGQAESDKIKKLRAELEKAVRNRKLAKVGASVAGTATAIGAGAYAYKKWKERKAKREKAKQEQKEKSNG